MRINIEVPLPYSNGHKANTASSAPPALIKLAPSGELVLIELQGSLEIDDAHPEGGQALGKLEFHPGREDRPTLLISHHRLEGKIVALTKPFAVLQKKKRSLAQEDRIEEHIEPSRRVVDVNSSPLLSSRNGNRVHDRDEEDEGGEQLGEPASPSMSRKRARGEVGKITHQTPIKALNRAVMVPSSSPMPRAPLRGSELDFSSPIPARSTASAASREQQVEYDDGQDWMHKKSTSTYFEVVCIIRKKMLFTKRPEPVVRLDGEGGEEARKALGLAAAQ